jgi:DNA-binding Lrp family transcriptional regulator
MNQTEQNNKIKILEELQKNGRASTSEIADKLGLSRQTVTKTIRNMEKNKEIWGYTAIFDPRLLGKKYFIMLCRVDISKSAEEVLKKVIDPKVINDNENRFDFVTSMFLHLDPDLIVIFMAKDIIEAKKRMNFFAAMFADIIKEIKLVDVISTFRHSRIASPKMVEEWTNLLI